MSLLDTLGLSDSKKTVVPNAEFVAFINDEPNAETMRSFVTQRMLPHALVQRGKIAHAITYLRKVERAPRQLVVDVSDMDTPLSALTQLAEVCDPSIEVYVLGSKNDVGLYRNLLQLGVRDYLVKPLTVELLTRTLGAAQAGKSSEHVQRSRTGKVISFIGARGGVGVSTVCAHLALHLAEDAQRRVALVDLNVYGGAINIILAQQSNQGLVDVLQNVQRLDPQYMERTLVKHSSRLFLLTCELDYRDQFTIPDGSLSALIKVLQHHFHYVIIDAPQHGSGQTQLTEEALDQSKLVYLLADRTVHAARTVTRLSRHIVARANEPTLSLLINHTAPVNAALVSADDFANATQRAVLLELPFDASTLTLAQNLGQRIKPHSPFGKVISRLANDLSGVEQKVERTALWGGGSRVNHMVR